MELRHLRYFLAVAECGTVTAAAVRLHVAQPAISRQLHRLERDLGVALFTRNGPRLVLTHAGRQMRDVAADIVTRADRAAMVAQQMAGGLLTRVVVAAAPTTIEYVLAPFVATLSPSDPFVSVDSVAPDGVHEAVLGGHDLGVAATAPPTGRLVWTRLTSVPLRAYVAPDHPWARRRTVPLDELVHAPLLVPPPTDPTRLVLDEAVAREQLRYDRYEQIAWPPLSQALAVAGRGVAVVTNLEQFGARPIVVTDCHDQKVLLTIHACWDPDHYAATALTEFAARLAAFADTEVRSAAHAFS
ncbi:LysR family transcriptional regulator [Nonomuraea sp. NPDC046570]|uniref:LysR family transcriptional regulator n=1 Tax=Nonomuraea sp. NPDC046570 TaxID=3155255 RepID=UPI0033E382F1